MKLCATVTKPAGDRPTSQLIEETGEDTANLVRELRESGDRDYWNTKILPNLLKADP